MATRAALRSESTAGFCAERRSIYGCGIEIVGYETAERYALKFQPLDDVFQGAILNYEALAFYV